MQNIPKKTSHVYYNKAKFQFFVKALLFLIITVQVLSKFIKPCTKI